MTVADLTRHADAIKALCEQFHVRRLEVFGSTARGNATAESDVDFLVEFENLGWKGSFDRYMGFKFGLEDLLGRPVDLIEPHAIANKYFKMAIDEERRMIYAA